MSHSRHFARDYNVRPLQCQIPSFPCEIAISGPNNIRSHDFRARLQYQAPTMSDPTLFMVSYNIRPRERQTPRFSSDQAPTMSDPTVFVESYNIRPRQCQTPRFVGSYNIRPRQCQIPRFSYETIRLRLGYGRPHPTPPVSCETTMSGLPTILMQNYNNIRQRTWDLQCLDSSESPVFREIVDVDRWVRRVAILVSWCERNWGEYKMKGQQKFRDSGCVTWNKVIYIIILLRFGSGSCFTTVF